MKLRGLLHGTVGGAVAARLNGTILFSLKFITLISGTFEWMISRVVGAIS